MLFASPETEVETVGFALKIPFRARMIRIKSVPIGAFSCFLFSLPLLHREYP